MWSHFNFALVFAGLGYIGLWAFAAADVARHLSPGLQLAGIAAALAAVVRVAMMLRARRAPAAAGAASAAPSGSGTLLVRQLRRNGILRRAPGKRRPVAPREEFGLRKPGPWPKKS